MNNQDIYRFVNSKDIRRHLEEIGYSFTTAEAAWLVYKCHNATFAEKIKAFEDIIKTMPDQSVDSAHFKEPYESIHQVLREFINTKKKTAEMFYEKTPGSFYQYTSVNAYPHSVSLDNYDDSVAYSSYESCLHQLKLELSQGKNDEDLFGGCIRRSQIDCFYYIEADYNRDGELLDISIPASYGILDWHIQDFFNDLWFHFPVPYEKGDILYDPFHPNRCDCPGPVVMDDITPLRYAQDGRDHTDSSDMNVCGYFQEEDSGTIYHEVTWNYMDYEYFPSEKLTGKKRILKALSNYIKGEISEELLLRAYHLIILEETRNDLMPCGWFTDEGLKLAGIYEEKG